MLKYFKTVLVGLAVFSIAGCSEEEPMSAVIDVPIVFQKYVDNFIQEGDTRGYDIDFADTGLSIQFGTLPAEAAGSCGELGGGMSGSHEIKIRKEYWGGLSDVQRERLIFHELGH